MGLLFKPAIERCLFMHLVEIYWFECLRNLNIQYIVNIFIVYIQPMIKTITRINHTVMSENYGTINGNIPWGEVLRFSCMVQNFYACYFLFLTEKWGYSSTSMSLHYWIINTRNFFFSTQIYVYATHEAFSPWGILHLR